jgi:tetratricopeptide (TPR) repeat protein
MEEAVPLFEKALQANPRSARALNNLGLAKRKLGQTNEAIKAYKRAIEGDPSFALAYKNLGIALEQIGDKQGAVKAYQKYTELNPSAPDLKAIKESISKLMASGKDR